jgi:hypothetical protein
MVVPISPPKSGPMSDKELAIAMREVRVHTGLAGETGQQLNEKNAE